MFMTAYENGDIYKSQYEGWYDVRNEKFLTETQAKETNYKDPVSGKEYTKNSEETYFFRMGKYQQRLLDHIRKNPLCIEPEKSYQLILRRLTDNKLEDLCVSRSTFNWGIPVPLSWIQISQLFFLEDKVIDIFLTLSFGIASIAFLIILFKIRVK